MHNFEVRPLTDSISGCSLVAMLFVESQCLSWYVKAFCCGRPPGLTSNFFQTYGALNAVLFATYNRSLGLLCPLPGNNAATTPRSALTEMSNGDTTYPYWAHFASGCLAGLATFVISAPTEVVKCRAQVAQASSSGSSHRITSWQIVQDLWHERGMRGFYHGGIVTALRDAIGYGFYYLTYECSKDLWNRMLVPASAQDQQQGQPSSSAVKILVCGGIAGVATWASIFPLDVIKTRVQTQELSAASSLRGSNASPRHMTANESSPLVPSTQDHSTQQAKAPRKGAWAIARQAYRTEGLRVFFRGIGVCCARAFVVNAVQWSVYEEVMKVIAAEAT